MSSPASQQPSPQLFFETINAYQRTEALKAAIELEVFTAVAEGNTTPRHDRKTMWDLRTRHANPLAIRIFFFLCSTYSFSSGIAPPVPTPTARPSRHQASSS